MSSPQQRSKFRGKNAEYRLAKKVKGVVVGRSKAVITDKGAVKIDPNKPPDVIGMDGLFSYESKWIVHVPANIRKVMEQARRNAPEGLIPVGVIGDRTGHRVYYILEEKDWTDLHI